MSELLFEIFCEEIPARMQPRAEADLERLLGDKLKAAGLGWDSLKTFAGPRRLGLVIDGLPAKTQDVRDERKGTKVGAPDKAIKGFLRSAGLDSLDQCEKRDTGKGQKHEPCGGRNVDAVGRRKEPRQHERERDQRCPEHKGDDRPFSHYCVRRRCDLVRDVTMRLTD